MGGRLGKWVQSFLSCTTQVVLANNIKSSTSEIVSGVPQESVLFPLLFLVLIDSLADINMDSKIRIFADDTRVGREIRNENDASSLQNDLDSLYQWVHTNNMEFNGLKFQAIKYGKNLELKTFYHYENSDMSEPIEDVEDTRDLGLIMSEDGTFTKYINKVISKANRLGQ